MTNEPTAETIAFLHAPDLPPVVQITASDGLSHGEGCDCPTGRAGFTVILGGPITLRDCHQLLTLIVESITTQTVVDPATDELVFG